MRGWAVLGILWCGCGFHVAAAGGDAAVTGDGTDAPAAGGDAPDAFVQMPACMTEASYTGDFNGHRYRKTSTVNYDGAADACAADGGHLAVIDSMAENTFVGTFAGADCFIGYDDLTTENVFRWVNGAASSFVGFTGGEPNDNGVEDCTYTRSDGTWNDTNCGDSRQAICECEPTYQAPPTPACRAMPGAVVHDGRSYFIHTAALPWAEAKATCEATGAHLAVFSDLDENDAVDNEFVADSWIGYTDRAVEGLFVWVNGSPDTYTNWSAQAPRPNNLVRSCVVVNIVWDDIDCAVTKRYACECDPLPP